MVTLIMLVIVGAVLICLEVFVPGAILGILGVASLITASVIAYKDYGMLAAVVVGLVGAVLALVGVIVEFIILPKTKFGKSLILSEGASGKSEYQQGAEQLMNKEGITLTVFAPSGRLKIESKIYEAYSLDGHLEKDEKVKVVGIDNFRLLVKHVKKSV
jgi:membrane-bound ClpP family serine protease